jgi:hypothetical protein
MRTFSRSDWDAALRAWDEGEFSDEWKPVRHQAAMRGMLYPPDGTRWDSWEDDEPSQRAQLIRAIRETPGILARAIAHSKTWYEVIAYVNARRDEVRRELDFEEAAIARRRVDEDRPVESAAALKAILNRISDS